MKFFKKLSPETAVAYQGQQISFSTLDQVTGYFAVQDEAFAQFLKTCIERNQYGLCEISEEEFHRDYVEPKKKGLQVPPKSQWFREQMGASGLEGGRGPLSVLGAERLANAVAVERKGAHVNGAGVEAVLEDPAAMPPKALEAKAPEEVKPTVGKRSSVKKKTD